MPSGCRARCDFGFLQIQVKEAFSNGTVSSAKKGHLVCFCVVVSFLLLCRLVTTLSIMPSQQACAAQCVHKWEERKLEAVQAVWVMQCKEGKEQKFPGCVFWDVAACFEGEWTNWKALCTAQQHSPGVQPMSFTHYGQLLWDSVKTVTMTCEMVFNTVASHEKGKARQVYLYSTFSDTR